MGLTMGFNKTSVNTGFSACQRQAFFSLKILNAVKSFNPAINLDLMRNESYSNQMLLNNRHNLSVSQLDSGLKVELEAEIAVDKLH